jgi:hypothetical protein
MNLVRATTKRLLISISPEDLLGASNALNEVCNGIDIGDAEFQTRLGRTRTDLRRTLQAFSDALCSPVEASSELVTVWRDGMSIQVRAISAFGDPVDMGVDEARVFATQILDCAREADS